MENEEKTISSRIASKLKRSLSENINTDQKLSLRNLEILQLLRTQSCMNKIETPTYK